MRQLVYVSSATHLMADPELNEILAASRRRNPADGVTGMLLYIDGGFLQVLEGEDDNVAAVYERICGDRRHRGCRILVDQPTDDRLFANWSMGFERLDRNREEAADVFRITREALSQALPAEGAREIATFLHTFYYVNTREPQA